LIIYTFVSLISDWP